MRHSLDADGCVGAFFEASARPAGSSRIRLDHAGTLRKGPAPPGRIPRAPGHAQAHTVGAGGARWPRSVPGRRIFVIPITAGPRGGAVERASSKLDGGYATEPKGTRYDQYASWNVCRSCPRSQRAPDRGLRRVQAVGRATLRLHERCVQAVQRTSRQHGWHLCVPAGEEVLGEREVTGAIRGRIEGSREDVGRTAG